VQLGSLVEHFIRLEQRQVTARRRARGGRLGTHFGSDEGEQIEFSDSGDAKGMWTCVIIEHGDHFYLSCRLRKHQTTIDQQLLLNRCDYKPSYRYLRRGHSPSGAVLEGLLNALQHDSMPVQILTTSAPTQQQRSLCEQKSSC
jgi:hypothetical protein